MLKFVFILIFYFVSIYNGWGNEIQQSYFKFTTSNGLIVSVYNQNENRIDYVYPHIFARIDSTQQVLPFIGNMKLSKDEKPTEVSYQDNTHVIAAKYKDFTIYYTASFVNENKVFYVVARGEKDKVENLNFYTEATPNTTVSGIDHLENAYEDLPCRIAGEVVSGSILKHYKNNLYEKYFLYSFTDSLHTDRNIISKAIDKLNSSDSSLIDQEVAFARALIDKCNIPSTLSGDERNAIEQSIVVLKMSQVSDKEVLPHSHGQIMASLRPGLWHMAWVRDGSFAIQAMTRLGMYDEARKGLEFMLKAPANRYQHYIHTDGIDYGPGMDYQIALMAYYGNGTDDYCATENGPNIEYDNFGVFLIAFMDYIKRSNDEIFFDKWNNVVKTKIADVIIHCMDKSNNLIKADSGPWEHWLMLPKQYTYTSAVCARGLELFADKQKGTKRDYKQYSTAAKKLKKAILGNMLIDKKYFKGNINDQKTTDYEYWDGGTFEMFANGLVGDCSLFRSHIDAYNKVLRIPDERLGYVRLPSTDPYENQEWVFINLRIAYAHILLGNREIAGELISYITQQAVKNNHHIPEMISNKKQMSKIDSKHKIDEIWCNCIRDEDNLYIATIPMVGYGAGAYAMALLAYHGY